MTVADVISVLPKNTHVRVNCHSDIYTGDTGQFKTKHFIELLSMKNCANAFVTGIYPLWHAHEVYIECVRC